MEEKIFLPKISRKELKKNTDSWDYFYAVLDLYFEEMDKKGEEYFWNNINDSQAIITIYNFLSGQVNNGGFIQMIYNGYGWMVLYSPFIDLLEQIGIKKLSNLLKEVKELCEKYKENFEKVDRNNLEEFSKLYEQMPEFDALDDKFYEIENDEFEILVKYLKENISDFVEIID